MANEENNVKEDLLKLQRQLLQSIADRDWTTYAKLCDESLTAFEPEAGETGKCMHGTMPPQE